MALASLQLLPSYRSDDANIATDFMVPCLREAWRYDRATGYFTSGVLPLILRGLEPFVARGGTIRLVASPHLTIDDVDQIREGYAFRDMVFEQRATDVLDELAAIDPDAYGRLAWLVANGALDIRLAFPRREPTVGIYHEKFGVFSDDRDSVAFCGSLNETFAAFEGNFEYIDVYTSRNEPARVSEKQTFFDRLWNGQTARLDILEFPEALRRRLILTAPSEYVEQPKPVSSIIIPEIKELRGHQIRALAAWRKNDCFGILEMATGTGKTFTALSAARQMLDDDVIASVVILAPYIPIADQWRMEATDLLALDPIVCHSMSGDWRSHLRSELALSRFEKRKTCVVALYDTASGAEFKERVEQLPKPVLLIADEVHNVTVESADALLAESYMFRLGLSATPERYLDPIGTERTTRYFGGIVFRYTLGDAIAAEVLVPYNYFPIICGQDDSVGFSSLRGGNAAKLNKFVRVFEATEAATQGFALVYCQPQQLPETKEWLGLHVRKAIHTFTAREDLSERREILRQFGRGDLFALVAMRCLDEGVDVPPTRSAFLLGSSENPKQFIQRRGRVLRKYPGKKVASIYDFIYLPPPNTKSNQAELSKELARFGEFALTARNATDATKILTDEAFARGIVLGEYVKQGV